MEGESGRGSKRGPYFFVKNKKYIENYHLFVTTHRIFEKLKNFSHCCTVLNGIPLLCIMYSLVRGYSDKGSSAPTSPHLTGEEKRYEI
jgi:hypothetical protein